MYEIFYNFSAEPFRLSPDHRFCFEHKSYGKARAYMAYAFKRAEGFVMITGRPGTGKTTLIGELVESLSKEKVVTANLVCTQLQADDLLKTVAYSFGISLSEVGKAELLQRLTVLLHRWHREGRRALLVVDEAQDLSSSAMEELRLLTNIQFGGQPLLQIFLLGQPELRDLILSPEMEQVHQRIVAASHIEGLEVDETEAYVIHRLTVVGWRGDPAIDRAIFPLIHRFSEGVPRRINLICSRLFLLGSVEERHAIEVADVRVVIAELQAENLAAGTGISQQDFRNSAEPDWVPVPADQSAVPPSTQLKSVDNTFYVGAEQASDQAVEAKKKGTPSPEPLANPAPDDDSTIPGAPVTRVECIPEADSAPLQISSAEASVANVASVTAFDSGVTEMALGVAVGTAPDLAASASSDTGAGIAPDRVLPAPDDSDRSAVASGGLAVESAAPRKRLIVMALLMLSALVLILVGKDYFFTEEGLVYEYLRPQRAPSDRSGALDNASSVASGAGAVDRVSDGPSQIKPVPSADRQSEPEALPEDEIASKDQELLPIVIDKSLRRLLPVVVEQNILPEDTSRVADEAALEAASTAGFSSKGEPEAAVAESVGDQDWQQTILITFSFDSDELFPDARQALDRAAKMLREHTQAVATITGFTDNRGDSRYNLMLSHNRALAVERYLVDAGIDRQRLQVEGRGVLTRPLEGIASGVEDSFEPFRVVQIKLSGEG